MFLKNWIFIAIVKWRALTSVSISETSGKGWTSPDKVTVWTRDIDRELLLLDVIKVQIKLYLLSFRQRAEPTSINIRLMNKDVLAVWCSDKSKALRFVEELNIASLSRLQLTSKPVKIIF